MFRAVLGLAARANEFAISRCFGKAVSLTRNRLRLAAYVI
jgi:hypothetical protein